MAQISLLGLEEVRRNLGPKQERDVAREDLDREDAPEVGVLLAQQRDGPFHELQQAAHEGDRVADEGREVALLPESQKQVAQQHRDGEGSQQQHGLRGVGHHHRELLHGCLPCHRHSCEGLWNECGEEELFIVALVDR